MCYFSKRKKKNPEKMNYCLREPCSMHLVLPNACVFWFSWDMNSVANAYCIVTSLMYAGKTEKCLYEL